MKRNTATIIRSGIMGLICLLLFGVQTVWATNISETYKYAWSENAGWHNWRSTNAQATVHTSYLSGYVWAENVGWIKLGSGTGPYSNTSSSNWGVNRSSATGALSGYAWSENAGWINFSPIHGGVSIDLATGSFVGYAWGENIGWINFECDAPPYNVKLALISPGIYYVNISAAGEGDGSSGSPWKTLHYAIDQINLGNSGGSYTLNVALVPETNYSKANGEADAELILRQSNVTIVGASGSAPVIDGTGAAAWTKGLTIEGSNCTIQNLYITGFSDDSDMGIEFNSGSNNLVENCKFYVNETGVVFGSTTWGNTLKTSEIYQNNKGIVCNSTNVEYPNVISQNTIHNNANNGIFVENSSPEISRNTIYDNTFNLSISAGNQETASPVIKNNLIYEASTDAVDYGIYVGGNAGSMVTPEIYHNTIDGGTYEGILIEGATDAPIIKYNIITNFRQYGIQKAIGSGSPIIDYNDVWNNGSGAADNYKDCLAGAHDISSNPLYGSYTLLGSSPCINAIPIGNPPNDPVTVDIDGTARPYGSGFDMGCYENTSLPAVTTAAASSITSTTATSGGTVNSPSPLTEGKGVCWSTSANPTILNSHTSDGTETGLFVSNITGLSPSTTYYVRAYATNSAGTGYGGQVSFTTSAATPTKVELTGPLSVVAGSVSSAFTLTSLDANGNAANVTQNTVFSLTSNTTGTAIFYSDAAGTNAITQITIANGTSSATFYYKDTATGTPTVTATRTSGMELGSDTHQITVNSGTATKVDLTGPATVNSGAVSTAFTLTSLDANGNAANVTQNTVFSLTSNTTGTAIFYSDAAGTNAITQITIANGTSSATFYYKDTATGTPTVTATQTSGMALGSDTHQITVNAGAPTITSFSPISGGTGTSVTITGTHFTGAEVKFGGTNAASFTVDSETQITAVVGTGSTGKVTVTTAGGTAVSEGNFTFTATYSYPLPGGTGVVTDYRIFTVPLDLGTGADMLNAMEAALGAYNPARWRVFALASGSNIEINSGDFASLRIIPGMGFWIISLSTQSVNFRGGLAPDGVSYQIALSTGWHMIALPWPATDITLGSITVSDGTNTYAITSDSNTLTQTSVWDYTGSGPYSGYEKRQTSAYALLHGVGYFLKVLSASAVTVTIPPVGASATTKGLNAASSGRNDEEPPPGFPCRVSGHSAAASSGRPILPLPPDGLTGLPTCPECSVSMAKRELQNIEFAPGDACECTATESITIGTGVTIKSGANVTFKAPKVNLQSGFSAEKGAVVQIKQE